MAEVFLINKKITVDKPLTGIISKYDKALLQFMTASLITNYNNLLLHLTIAWLLQFSTTVVTINDRYYNLRRLLLQFTTCITTHDIITIHDRYPPMICSPLLAKQYFPRQRRPAGVHRLRTTWSSLWEVICNKKIQKSFLNQSLDPPNQNFLNPLLVFLSFDFITHILPFLFSLLFTYYYPLLN